MENIEKRNSYEVGAIIWANIRKRQMLEKMSDIDLANILGVSTRTLYNYNSKPETLTLEKIQLFIDSFGLDIEDLVK